MRALLDTSVFVASFWGDHPQHDVSVRLYKSVPKDQAFCAAHSLAEVYSAMTRLPVRPLIPPDQASLFVQDIVGRYNIVALDANEYLQTIQDLSDLGLARNLIYDALIIRSGRKADVERIFTWDIDDFRRIAPDLASRIETP